MLQGAKCSNEQKCSRKQNVLGSKVFQEANCSRDQNVLRSKILLDAKYASVKCAQQKSVLGNKVCVSLSHSNINSDILTNAMKAQLCNSFLLSLIIASTMFCSLDWVLPWVIGI